MTGNAVMDARIGLALIGLFLMLFATYEFNALSKRGRALFLVAGIVFCLPVVVDLWAVAI